LNHRENPIEIDFLDTIRMENLEKLNLHLNDKLFCKQIQANLELAYRSAKECVRSDNQELIR